ncbi:Hypothetical predicted protein [Mytilus galloprovincialis]|uniref:Ig-like domain-containing protein n=1 Tax=Mytilus galloprovincialis TaxID=29158 RepID=A0A8B6G0U4_MYTGA|nr:Hypothetical predicted protein [Mytilus galloprovincialis]
MAQNDRAGSRYLMTDVEDTGGRVDGGLHLRTLKVVLNMFQELLHVIGLRIKPNITPFSPDTLDTEETTSFNISCQSYGSRPTAFIYWLIGQQNSNVTSNSSTESIHDSSTNTYTVISTLKYRVDRRYNGQKLIFRASNVAGYMETSLTLNVKYAPTVNVENKTFSYNQSQRQIRSTLDGNPTINTCNWHHRSKYGEHIRDFMVNNQILTLPTVPKHQLYQDTGEYICTAENGISGLNGQVKQIGSGYVTSNAPPVITADNKDNTIQYGTLGQSTELKINVYSIPKYSNIRWYKGSILLGPKKYVTMEEPAVVKDVFHGVNVHLDGNRVTLTITDLQKADFTTYTLRLYYGSQYVVHEVTLKSVEAHRASKTDVIIGATTGVLVALLVMCIIIILVLKSKKGKTIHSETKIDLHIFQL